jgi:uncharacterized protein (TIGR00369 family)
MAATANERHVREMFRRSDFMMKLGVELSGLGNGWCETSMTPTDEHRQQHGFVHAAVLFALADHTAGGAAGTMVTAEQDVITVENKITYLRPAIADRLRCRGEVLRAGKSLIFSEAEVFAIKDAEEKLVAKLMSTLSVIPNRIS